MIRILYSAGFVLNGKGPISNSLIQTFPFEWNFNYASDRTFLNDFSNSGVFRALPSQESNFLLNQQLDHGGAFFLAQYIQPLNDGGALTFQRLPEIGHRFLNYQLWDSPFVVGMESAGVHFWREESFTVSRLDLMPGITTQGVHLGNVVGLKPELKLRGIGYTRGQEINDPLFRTTFWGAMEMFSNLSRRFKIGDGGRVRHSLQPKVVYEFVPDTNPDRYVQVDEVDDLIAKNLVTYSLNTRISEQSASGRGSTWLDLLVAQSYHVNEIPDQAERFSNIWVRAKMNKPISFSPLFSSLTLGVDSFVDPNKGELAQIIPMRLFKCEISGICKLDNVLRGLAPKLVAVTYGMPFHLMRF